MPETYSFISRDHIEHVALCIEVLFSLCWRDVSDGAKQAQVVEPIDPSELGHFQIVYIAPRTLAMNEFGFVETRTPAGYTLSDGNQTAVNTSGGINYQRWVPATKALLPSDGRRYWEVLCAPGGAVAFDGYLGIVSDAQREDYDTGNNPITLGSIGWRGNGSLWSSNTAPAPSSA